ASRTFLHGTGMVSRLSWRIGRTCWCALVPPHEFREYGVDPPPVVILNKRTSSIPRIAVTGRIGFPRRSYPHPPKAQARRYLQLSLYVIGFKGSNSEN